MWHLNSARVEKIEVTPDNTAPKSYLPLFVENYYWALTTNLETRVLRQEKNSQQKGFITRFLNIQLVFKQARSFLRNKTKIKRKSAI